MLTGTDVLVLAAGIFMSVLLASWVIVRFWDKQPFVSYMGYDWHGKDALKGFVMAVVIMAVGFVIMWLPGWIRVSGAYLYPSSLALSFLDMLLSVMATETIRGFLLRQSIDAGVNKYLALLLVSLIQPMVLSVFLGSSILYFFNLLLFNILIGVAFIHTRNLWFPISFHLFFNYLDGPILGLDLSISNYYYTVLSIQSPDQNLSGVGSFLTYLTCTLLMLFAIAFILYRFARQRHPEMFDRRKRD